MGNRSEIENHPHIDGMESHGTKSVERKGQNQSCRTLCRLGAGRDKPAKGVERESARRQEAAAVSQSSRRARVPEGGCYRVP